jgi:hypothetical protein
MANILFSLGVMKSSEEHFFEEGLCLNHEKFSILILDHTEKLVIDGNLCFSL